MAHNKNKLSFCSNCGYKFTGPDNFCPECGQENHDIRLPLKHYIHELIEGLLHLDSKAMHTFFYLIVKPGLLSKEFNEGRRVKFIPPVRIYIFISFLFFLLLSTGKIIHKESSSKSEDPIAITFFSSSLDSRVTKEERAKLTVKQADSLQIYRSRVTTADVAGLTYEQIDSVMVDKKIDKSWINKLIFRQMSKAGDDGAAHLFKLVQRNASYGMFLLMPFIGLIIYLFYRRKSTFIIENLVISVHYHCVIFLIFSIVVFINKFISFDIGYLIGFLFIPAYLYFMLKKYYGQNRFISLIKTISIGIIQFISTLIFYLLITFITIMLL
jgi:hypothetical protein